MELIDFLKKNYVCVLAKRYELQETENNTEILAQIAKNRGCVARGEEVDYSKAAMLMIDDFRSGRLGRITLEFPAKEE